MRKHCSTSFVFWYGMHRRSRLGQDRWSGRQFQLELGLDRGRGRGFGPVLWPAVQQTVGWISFDAPRHHAKH